MKTRFLLLLLFLTTLKSLCQESIQMKESTDVTKSYDTLYVETYSSYNSSKLPQVVLLTNIISRYDSIINTSQELIGLPNTDIEIKTTNDYGAFSVINRKNQKRAFLYSPHFFDSIYSVTNTNLAIMSICFHELAHQFYRHPLKPSAASHIYEKQADRYSGFQMCIIGATLEQALAAVNNFGAQDETETHPDKASRIAEITKGFIDARIKIFKDSTYLEKEKKFKINELIYALHDNKTLAEIKSMDSSIKSIKSYKKKAISKSKTYQVYTLYGELIYFTLDNKIKLLYGNETIGEAITVNESLGIKILNLDGVRFQLEKASIFSTNPDGSKVEVGIKITK